MSRRAATRAGRIRIGISGWRYAGWRGSFYPKGLRQADELAYATRHFDTIEINGTPYSLQLAPNPSRDGMTRPPTASSSRSRAAASSLI